MHRLPTEWADYASDGNGDGVMSPDNMYDATIGTGEKRAGCRELNQGATKPI